MQLTETQITQANALIKKYKFCSLETQKELQESGFFDVVNCNLYLGIPVYDKNHENECRVVFDNDLWLYSKYGDGVLSLMPMPQFHEIWEVLPKKIGYSKINIDDKIIIYKDFYNGIVAVDINENLCEAACKMWIKLKEQNLL